MSQSEKLQILNSFGTSLNNALVFAVKESDWEESESNEFPVYALKIDGHVAQIKDVLKQPVIEIWQSKNGAAYCPSTKGQMLIYNNNSWNSEVVCDRNEEFGYIWGISGSSISDDSIYIVSDTSFFTRINEIWKEYPLPEDIEMTYRMHGLSPKEIYICTDSGLLLWDGEVFEEVEGPDDEPSAVYVLSDSELLVVGDSGVYLWTEELDWQELESPTDEVANGITAWGKDIFIPSLEGILKFHDGVITKVDKFSCNKILNIGNAILAAGSEGGLLMSQDGVGWSEINVPQV